MVPLRPIGQGVAHEGGNHAAIGLFYLVGNDYRVDPG